MWRHRQLPVCKDSFCSVYSNWIWAIRCSNAFIRCAFQVCSTAAMVLGVPNKNGTGGFDSSFTLKRVTAKVACSADHSGDHQKRKGACCYMHV